MNFLCKIICYSKRSKKPLQTKLLCEPIKAKGGEPDLVHGGEPDLVHQEPEIWFPANQIFLYL
jgi:hypothetical protein